MSVPREEAARVSVSIGLVRFPQDSTQPVLQASECGHVGIGTAVEQAHQSGMRDTALSGGLPDAQAVLEQSGLQPHSQPPCSHRFSRSTLVESALGPLLPWTQVSSRSVLARAKHTEIVWVSSWPRPWFTSTAATRRLESCHSSLHTRWRANSNGGIQTKGMNWCVDVPHYRLWVGSAAWKALRDRWRANDPAAPWGSR